MITSTSLKNTNYLARVKAAIERAVRKAHAVSPVPELAVRTIAGYAEVYSVRGRLSLEVYAYKGGRLMILCNDEDVTARVMAALRDYHAKPAPLPLVTVDFDSGPMPLHNVRMVAA